MKRLSESVWGDIRKKSLGQEDRAEENVNNFSLKELCEYTKSRYNLSFDSAVHLSETTKGLCLDAVICEGGKRNILFFVQYNEKKRIIQFSKDIVELFPYIYQKLLEKYHIANSYLYSDNNLYAIYRSELKDVDNKLFIEVVDIIVDNFPADFSKEIYITKKK